MTALKTMASEMAQGLGALVTLPKDPRVTVSTYMVLTIICNSVPEF